MLSKSTINWRIKRLQTTIGRMHSASTKVDAFSTSMNNLEKLLGSNLKIDDKTPYKELLDSASTKSQSVKGSMSGIVSSLYYRINKYKKQLAEEEEE